MKRYLMVLGAIVGFVWAFSVTDTASALALRVQPLSYKETIAQGEKKKGFIDITNPTGQTLNLVTSVQAFRQTDNNGSLEFYDEPKISAGITPDLNSFALKPGQTMRLVFQIDGTKLPQGDIFASLMVTNKPDQLGNFAQAVRVGTLLMLVNGTPGARQAAVTKLSVPFVQVGQAVSGSYTIKNTAPADTSSGFSPEVDVTLSPFTSSKKQTSSLLFAGRERSNEFSISANRIGFYQVSVGFGASKQTSWVFIISPLWITIIVGLVLITIVISRIIKRRRSTLSFSR